MIEIDDPGLLFMSFVADFVPNVLERVDWRFRSQDPSISGLSGVVQDPCKYRQMQSGLLESLELLVHTGLKRYRGYSGGPVEVARDSDSASWGVGGLLLEELMEDEFDRSDDARASKILYAATLSAISSAEVLRGIIFAGLTLREHIHLVKSGDHSKPANRADEREILRRRFAEWMGVGHMTREEHDRFSRLADEPLDAPGGDADAGSAA
ncbi:hypothetical protein [Paenarthrobacter ilicis]|uniref:hypothetical protein n=1 Tax=Paenarthrobacter ilicis TaxID=43665 RepID=UPI003868E098